MGESRDDWSVLHNCACIIFIRFFFLFFFVIPFDIFSFTQSAAGVGEYVKEGGGGGSCVLQIMILSMDVYINENIKQNLFPFLKHPLTLLERENDATHDSFTHSIEFYTICLPCCVYNIIVVSKRNNIIGTGECVYYKSW
jgi:hypothetical protein